MTASTGNVAPNQNANATGVYSAPAAPSVGAYSPALAPRQPSAYDHTGYAASPVAGSSASSSSHYQQSALAPSGAYMPMTLQPPPQ